MWEIRYSRSALQALRRIPRNLAETIQAKIAALAVDPFAANNHVKRLKGREGFRLRVGDWRVLYDLENRQLIVLDIKPRGGAYR